MQEAKEHSEKQSLNSSFQENAIQGKFSRQ